MDKPNWSPEVQAALCELLNQQLEIRCGITLYHVTGDNNLPGLVVVAIGPDANLLKQVFENSRVTAEIVPSELN